MLGVTVFGIFFTPVFYVVIRWFSGRRTPAAPALAEAGAEAASPQLADGLHSAKPTVIAGSQTGTQ
jgi:hypothetical protein